MSSVTGGTNGYKRVARVKLTMTRTCGAKALK